MSHIAATFRRLLREEGGWGKVYTGLAMAVALAGGGLVYQQVAHDTAPPPPPPPGEANFWVDTTGGTCTRSSAGASYDDAAACGSLDTARDNAQCGDIIRVQTGTYGSQTLAGATSACTSNAVQIIGTGTTAFGTLTMNQSGTTIDNLDGSGSAVVTINETCVTCALKNGAWRGFNVWGADNVLLDGNVFDGANSRGRNYIQDSSPKDSNSPVQGITLTNNTIRNYCCDGAHEEGIYIGGETYNGLMDGNAFPDNGTTADATGHFFFTWCGRAQGDTIGCATPSLNTYPDNWCVRNNTFGDGPPFYAIQARPEIPSSNNIKIVSTQTSTLPLLGPAYSEWMLAASC